MENSGFCMVYYSFLFVMYLCCIYVVFMGTEWDLCIIYLSAGDPQPVKKASLMDLMGIQWQHNR